MTDPRSRPRADFRALAGAGLVALALLLALSPSVRAGVVTTGTFLGLLAQSLGASSVSGTAPTDEQVLSYEASTGELVWQADSGGAGDIEGVTAGSGLTGGGTSGTVTLDIGAGTGITVNANDIAVTRPDLFQAWLDPRDGVAPPGTAALAMSLFSTRNGHPIQEFPASEEDSTEDDSCEWVFRLPSTFSSSNNVQVDLLWMAEGATSGDVIWIIEVEAFGATELDLDSSSFDTAQTVTTTTSGTDGNTVLSSKQHTNAEFDGCAGGDYVRIRVTRNSNDASDTLAVRAQLLGVSVEEEAP